MAQGGYRSESYEKRAESLALESFEVFDPWDLLRGRDVFKDVQSLDVEMDEASLSHMAPNCATFSRAREISLKESKTPSTS